MEARQQAEFVQLVTRHQPSLRGYIITLMPGVEGVSDVLQETNIVLWEKRASYRPGTNFWAWACAIARYEVKAHRRKHARAGDVTLDEELARQLADESHEEADELDERLEVLEKCMRSLSREERQLIEHRYYTSEPLESLSEKIGRPVESLRVSLFRIRAALKKCVSGELAITRSRS